MIRAKATNGIPNEDDAINNRGQILGTSSLANGELHGFLFEGGAMIDLGNNVLSYGINDNGEIGDETAPPVTLEDWEVDPADFIEEKLARSPEAFRKRNIAFLSQNLIVL